MKAVDCAEGLPHPVQVFEQLAESGPEGALQEAREEENNSATSREVGCR